MTRRRRGTTLLWAVALLSSAACDCSGMVSNGNDAGGGGAAGGTAGGSSGTGGGLSGTGGGLSGTGGGNAGGTAAGGGAAAGGSGGGTSVTDAGPACSTSGPPLDEGGTSGIASHYTGDVGIENDPDVIWVENFNEDGGIAAAAARWDVIDPTSLAAMSLSTNVPPGSPLAHSADWNYASPNAANGSSVNFLKCLGGVATTDPRFSCESSAGGSGCCDCGTFCKPLPSTIEAVYFRYYVYVPVGADPFWHFFEMGGGAWCGCAGRQPDGYDTFHINTDMYLNDWKWDFYTYWVDEHPSGSGSGTNCPNNCCDAASCYWYGNAFLGGYGTCTDLRPPVNRGRWVSVEVMIKNNTFTGATANADGEQALWIDGRPIISSSSTGQCSQVVSHDGPGYPLGSWSRSTFCPDNAGQPFSTDSTAGHGFRWRKTPSFNVSWIRPQAYEQTAQTAQALDHLLVAHMVVAKKYIGPIKP